MTVQTQGALAVDGGDREGLARIADVILPGTATLPPGRAVGAHADLLDLVLTADPRVSSALLAFSAHALEAETISVELLRSWGEEDCELVVFALNSAYYMSTEVREKLGYPGQGRRPVALATADEICSDELIAPVIQRGDVFVPTPDSEGDGRADA